MTETVLMGLEGARTHGSYGALTVERVQHTLALAAKHGFTNVRLEGSASRPGF